LENAPLTILKDCIELLNFYVNEPNKLENKLKEIGKLFCLGYIKSYIYTFIKSFEDENEKRKFIEPKKILEVINGDNAIYKMIRIYIYKILYNSFGADVFINRKMIETYLLNNYKGFNEFIKVKELYNICKIDYTIRTLKDDKFNEANSSIGIYKRDEFKKKLDTTDFDLEEFGIDNFYVISYNLIFSNYQMENQDLDSNINFFNNICKPLFNENKLLFKAIELFYNPEKYKTIKGNFKINSNNIKAILFGYRYCLNELFSEKKRGIYYPLYTDNSSKYLTEQFYPGNDSKPNHLYCKIINHFKNKPNEGCYVCLCKTGFYHSVKSGFPGDKEFDKHCPRCNKNIGTAKKSWIPFSKEKIIVKRKDYYRIFKTKKEIEDIKKK
jgi:hypothetical protein